MDDPKRDLLRSCLEGWGDFRRLAGVINSCEYCVADICYESGHLGDSNLLVHKHYLGAAAAVQ